MSTLGPLAIDWVLAVTLFWLVLGLAGLAGQRNFVLVTRILFPAGALGGLVIAVAGLVSLTQSPAIMVLPLGLPELPFHLRLDALSGFFLMVLGGGVVGVSLFAAGYFRHEEGTAPGLLCLQYHVFIASMAAVFLADDAYLFMVAWETMALSSYFLVTTEHRIPEIRRAGFLYLLIAHIGALGILLCFGPLGGYGGAYTFAAMREAQLPAFWASMTFLLALFGFGAKAGILPLHVWLPEAHPAAPSPVSALMSGVMLKTAVYGILRISLDLLDTPMAWWGVLTLTLGLATALFGVLFAAVQSDIKRLLAYSSIENIGVILVGIGLTLTFYAYQKNALAALALTATLYHCLNHAFFKSLLFLSAGSVLHATGQRSLGKLGGLIHRMPWVAWLTLIGTLAIAGLPPLNGFVSEWLLLQTFLLTPELPQPYLNMLVPVAAAALVLAAALSGYVMVKFYGITFLGQPREPGLVQAHDAGLLKRLGMGWLALGCVLLGLLPIAVIQRIDAVTRMLLGQTLSGANPQSGWLFLAPVAPERASYSPLLFLLVIVAVVLLTVLIVRRGYHGRLRRGPPWDCGFPAQTPRMQDTAEGFGQPIARIFEPVFRIERHLPDPADPMPYYRKLIHDRWWDWLYYPIAGLSERLSTWVAWLQQGRISVYLMYSFLTLLALLVWVR